MRLWNSCIYINADARFQFNCDAAIPDGDLFDPASHQRFVKFGEVGSLLCDIILQVVDSLYLLVSCGSIDGGLLAEFSKPEYFIGNFIIGFFALSFLDKLLLQGYLLFVDVFNRGYLRSSDDRGNV